MKNIFRILIGLGLLFILGTAGASDIDSITVEQTLVQVVVSLIIIGIGYYGLKYEPIKKKAEHIKIIKFRKTKYSKVA